MYGDYLLMSGDDSPVHAYTRSHRGAVLAILLNLSPEEQLFAPLLSAPSAADILVNNYPSFTFMGEGIRLQPWQAMVFSCRNEVN